MPSWWSDPPAISDKYFYIVVLSNQELDLTNQSTVIRKPPVKISIALVARIITKVGFTAQTKNVEPFFLPKFRAAGSHVYL